MVREVHVVMNPTIFDTPVAVFADRQDAVAHFYKSWPMQSRRADEFIKPAIYIDGIFSLLVQVDGDEDD